MYYEIYIDSLFLVNFVMNLYLLLLVNRSVCRTATRLRLVMGATIGAVVYLIPFFFQGPIWLELGACVLIGNSLMMITAFPIHSLHAFWNIAERLIWLSFLMGGGVIFVIQRVSFVRKYMQGIVGIMGIGAVLFLLISGFLERKNNRTPICKVTLAGSDGKMKVEALVDSGNSLVEPISGKPVSIIERSVFQGLWKDAPKFYRVIPYHSIGKKRGILRGYLVSEIQIEVDGITRKCKDVYVAVSEESIGNDSVKMIVNPMLLKC